MPGKLRLARRAVIGASAGLRGAPARVVNTCWCVVRSGGGTVAMGARRRDNRWRCARSPCGRSPPRPLRPACCCSLCARRERCRGDLLGGIGGIAFVVMALAFHPRRADRPARAGQPGRLAVPRHRGVDRRRHGVYAYATYGMLHRCPRHGGRVAVGPRLTADRGAARAGDPALPGRPAAFAPLAAGAGGRGAGRVLAQRPAHVPAFQAPFGSLPNPLGTQARRS